MTAPAVPEEEIVSTLKGQLGNALKDARVERRGRISVIPLRETVREVAASLQRLGFDHAIAVAGVDYPNEKSIEVVYLVSSYSHDELKHIVLSLKVQVDRESPRLPTLTTIWESANLFEREAHEMFGVNFEGHPNLQKLLLQDNWEGPPPMRKDVTFPELA